MPRPRRRPPTAADINGPLRQPPRFPEELREGSESKGEREARGTESPPGGRHARPRTPRARPFHRHRREGPRSASLDRHGASRLRLDRRLLLYLTGGVVILGVGVVLGPRVLHATSGAPQPLPRSPLPAGSSQLVPGENPVVQAVGGGVATPVTAPPPPVRRPARVAPQRTR